MIIVGQKRDLFVNFNNIATIAIDNNETNREIFALAYNNAIEIKLGEYATEERAKEVLEEIIIRYNNWENLKAGQPTGLCLPVYEMPKEKIDVKDKR